MPPGTDDADGRGTSNRRHVSGGARGDDDCNHLTKCDHRGLIITPSLALPGELHLLFCHVQQSVDTYQHIMFTDRRKKKQIQEEPNTNDVLIINMRLLKYYS